MRLDFTKMHGLGNDFVFVEDFDGAFEPAPDLVARLCDRHFGVGGDGLIAVRREPGADRFYMHYLNADGSLAEMCGNGIRCFAKYLVDRDLVAGETFTVGTLGGPKEVSVLRDVDGTFVSATVDMGSPVLLPAAIPMAVEGDVAQAVPIETPEGTFEFTAVSMGNPHAVTFVDDIDTAPVELVGSYIEAYALFPNKTNVEFAQVDEENDRILLRVWERGVGETLACGTGACATVVAASLMCLVGRDATVRLPGGELRIHWEADGHVLMTGPAEQVFTGSIEL